MQAKAFLLALMLISCTPNSVQAVVPPPIEGGGALSAGGYGGRIIEVTSLADSGPGTLRAALEATEPRIVVFRVAGRIDLIERIKISNPYVTIAGQTAPGGGITVTGKNISSADPNPSLLSIETHDVIIQFMRFRFGRVEGLTSKADNITIAGQTARNIVIDHSSFSWGMDENLGIWQTGGDMTVSWSIFAEVLLDHSSGVLVGNTAEMTDIDLHHNFIAHNNNRFPLFKHQRGRVINNIAYNWKWWHLGVESGADVDIIGNKYVPGPETSKPDRNILWHAGTKTPGVSGTPSIYIAGNQAPAQSDPLANNWGFLEEAVDGWSPTGRGLSKSFYRRSRLGGLSRPITVHDVQDLDDILLSDVGASMRLNEDGDFVYNRDLVDQRVIQDYVNGTGELISHENEVGGYPPITSGSPYADNDGDGMADNWENRHFGNLSTARYDDASKTDTDNDGIYDLNEFLRGSDPQSATGSEDAVSNPLFRLAHRLLHPLQSLL